MTLHGALKTFFKYNADETLGNIKSLELFKSCNILTLDDIFNLELAKFMFKARNNSLPEKLNNIFIRTRHPRQKDFLVPLTNSKWGETALQYCGPKLWETIDTELRPKNISIKTFAKTYKKYLLENYKWMMLFSYYNSLLSYIIFIAHLRIQAYF